MPCDGCHYGTSLVALTARSRRPLEHGGARSQSDALSPLADPGHHRIRWPTAGTDESAKLVNELGSRTIANGWCRPGRPPTRYGTIAICPPVACRIAPLT